MEKRQLNFNAPLMSARRYSSPSKSSELVKRNTVEKPPPSRQHSLQPHKPDWESELSKPAAVPFHWEQIPGRPKGDFESQSQTPDGSNTPKLPPSRYHSGPQMDAFLLTDHAILLEKLNDSLSRGDGSDSESGEDAYSDALDKLSVTESRSFNYSVSGISGCLSSGVKPSGTFCIDTQTRDFMMNRFLPAAKAAVVEAPEYAVKKSSIIKKAVSGEMKPPLRQYSSDALPYYTQFINNMESEDDDQELIAPKKKSGKTWGILPRFCVKNSLCLLSPLPALKSKPKTRAPSPSTREIVSRMTRNAHSGPLEKNACVAVHKKKSHSGLLTRELPRIDNRFGNRSAGVSPLRHTRSGNISPYRNESPKSPFQEGAGFLGLPKEAEAFNAKIASSRKLFKALHDVSRNQINTADPVEKTVYIDYVNKKELSKPNQNLNEEWKNEVPPLPKSPSESWLWRTLPSISNPFLNQKKQGKKVLAANMTKWETIVKTSNLRHDHIRRVSYRPMKY